MYPTRKIKQMSRFLEGTQLKLIAWLIVFVATGVPALSAEEVPLYAGAQVVSQGVEGGASRIECSLPDTATQDSVSEFYRSKLSQTAGWTSVAVMETPWGVIRVSKRKDSDQVYGMCVVGKRLFIFNAPTSFGASSVNDWLSEMILLAGPPVAVVNGVPISAREFYRRLEYMPANVQVSEAGLYVLKDLINERLLEMIAKEENVLPTQEQIKRAMSDVVKQPGFEEKYREMGMSEDELRSLVYAQQVNFNLRTKGVSVSDAEIEEYYNREKDARFTSPEYAVVAAIFVDDKATLSRAMDMLSRGIDFGQVARELSTDPASAQSGGRLRRPITRTDPEIPEEVRTKVLATPVGAYTEPIEGADGEFVIFKVLDKQPASVKPLAEVKSQIRQTLMLEKGSKVNDVQARLVEYRKKAAIKVNLARYESRILDAFREEGG